MASNRSEGRNVHIYLSNFGVRIGGLTIDPSSQHITLADFYRMLQILILPALPVELLGTYTGRTFEVQLDNQVLPANETLLQPGDYLIRPCHPDIQLYVNDEPYIDRVISHPVTGRDDDFRDKVRARDGGCVLSGRVNQLAYRNVWGPFHACHIWPLQKGQEWVNHGIYRWITDSDGLDSAARMSSPQNGMIMDSGIHNLFDQYFVGVDPDGGYKIIVFDKDVYNIGGRYLSESARENGIHGVRDSLFRWHLRQCVFANMRSAGEPIWDYDCEDSGDVVGRVLRADTRGERLGDEVAARLVLTPFLHL